MSRCGLVGRRLRNGADVLRAGTPGTLLHDVLDDVALGEGVVVLGAETGAVEEDLLAVVSADEAETAIADQLLDLALDLGTAGDKPLYVILWILGRAIL